MFKVRINVVMLVVASSSVLLALPPKVKAIPTSASTPIPFVDLRDTDQRKMALLAMSPDDRKAAFKTLNPDQQQLLIQAIDADERKSIHEERKALNDDRTDLESIRSELVGVKGKEKELASIDQLLKTNQDTLKSLKNAEIDLEMHASVKLRLSEQRQLLEEEKSNLTKELSSFWIKLKPTRKRLVQQALEANKMALEKLSNVEKLESLHAIMNMTTNK